MPDAQNGQNSTNHVKASIGDWGIGFISYVKRKMHERRAKKQNETPVDRAARRTANATVTLAIFTVVLAGTSVGTVWILRNQLTEMHEGGIDTHALAEASTKQAKAADDFATSAEGISNGVGGAVGKLGQQAEDAEEFFRTDERAWVVVDQIATLESYPALDTFPPSFKYGVYAKNVGKTIARNVRLHVDSLFGNSPLNKHGIEMTQMRTWGGRKGKAFGPDKQGPQSLAPGERSTVPVIISGQAPKEYWTNTLIGRVDYTDAFNISHWKTFCYSVSDEKGNLAHCIGGNDEDHNPEPVSSDSTTQTSKLMAEIPQVGNPHTEQPPDKTKPQESYWHKMVKPDILPVWIGGLAALLASIAGLLTLWGLKEQVRVGLLSAKAGEEGAKAALLSAQSVINSERAWLVIGVEQTQNIETGALPAFTFTCLNQGKTPATIKGIYTGYSIVGDPFDLPVPMRDEDLHLMNLPDRTFIVSRDSFPIRPGVNPESILFNRKERGHERIARDFLVFYGRIVYHDVFGSWGPGRKPHVTSWCYVYLPETGALTSTGPDQYNSHT